jgi:hypothetical protein
LGSKPVAGAQSVGRIDEATVLARRFRGNAGQSLERPANNYHGWEMSDVSADSLGFTHIPDQAKVQVGGALGTLAQPYALN